MNSDYHKNVTNLINIFNNILSPSTLENMKIILNDNTRTEVENIENILDIYGKVFNPRIIGYIQHIICPNNYIELNTKYRTINDINNIITELKSKNEFYIYKIQLLNDIINIYNKIGLSFTKPKTVVYFGINYDIPTIKYSLSRRSITMNKEIVDDEKYICPIENSFRCITYFKSNMFGNVESESLRFEDKITFEFLVQSDIKIKTKLPICVYNILLLNNIKYNDFLNQNIKNSELHNKFNLLAITIPNPKTFSEKISKETIQGILKAMREAILLLQTISYIKLLEKYIHLDLYLYKEDLFNNSRTIIIACWTILMSIYNLKITFHNTEKFFVNYGTEIILQLAVKFNIDKNGKFTEEIFTFEILSAFLFNTVNKHEVMLFLKYEAFYSNFNENYYRNIIYNIDYYLPPLNSENNLDSYNAIYGPIDGSNWLIPGFIVMSQYPGSPHSKIANKKLKAIDKYKITKYYNLLDDEQLEIFTPYKINLSLINKDIECINFKIKDGKVANDDDVDKFTDELVNNFIETQNKILIHCWGGHGRTSTISAILLGKLFFLSSDEALRRVYLYHKCRRELRSNKVDVPETPEQIDQVKRILKKFHDKNK